MFSTARERPVQRERVADLGGHGVADAFFFAAFCDVRPVGVSERDPHGDTRPSLLGEDPAGFPRPRRGTARCRPGWRSRARPIRTAAPRPPAERPTGAGKPSPAPPAASAPPAARPHPATGRPRPRRPARRSRPGCAGRARARSATAGPSWDPRPGGRRCRLRAAAPAAGPGAVARSPLAPPGSRGHSRPYQKTSLEVPQVEFRSSPRLHQPGLQGTASPRRPSSSTQAGGTPR